MASTLYQHGREENGENKFFIAGTLKTYVLAPDDANAADTAAERIDNVGAKAFRIIPHTPAIAALEGIIFGYSTTAGDLSAERAPDDSRGMSFQRHMTFPAGY